MEKEQADPFSNVVKAGECPKLSPKSQDLLSYQIALNAEDKDLYVRISGNSGGGLFSRNWLKLEDIFTLLDKQKDKVISSSILKEVMGSGSANNCGFMSGILREIKLLEQSPKGIFSHQLTPKYENVKVELRKLSGNTKTQSDNKPDVASEPSK
ncbi:hypothetical protein KCN56_24530 [Photobacterium galatheae]|nr:hypothetical protein [Photobacterium galatheae]